MDGQNCSELNQFEFKKKACTFKNHREILFFVAEYTT